MVVANSRNSVMKKIDIKHSARQRLYDYKSHQKEINKDNIDSHGLDDYNEQIIREKLNEICKLSVSWNHEENPESQLNMDISERNDGNVLGTTKKELFSNVDNEVSN